MARLDDVNTRSIGEAIRRDLDWGPSYPPKNNAIALATVRRVLSSTPGL